MNLRAAASDQAPPRETDSGRPQTALGPSLGMLHRRFRDRKPLDILKGSVIRYKG